MALSVRHERTNTVTTIAREGRDERRRCQMASHDTAPVMHIMTKEKNAASSCDAIAPVETPSALARAAWAATPLKNTGNVTRAMPNEAQTGSQSSLLRMNASAEDWRIVVPTVGAWLNLVDAVRASRS
jgi:hypothetical protein